VIRIACSDEDWHALAALLAEALGAGHAAWSADALSGLVGDPRALCLVAGAPASGLAAARRAGDEAELLTLAVAPRARRAGLGAALTNAIADWARDGGAQALFLEVAQDAAPAQRLYRRLGFAKVGQRRGYYDRGAGRAVDADVMRLDLTA
jgi:ribosomal-protein-alanine N-acetyltransferase